jgi:hypothetical protein
LDPGWTIERTTPFESAVAATLCRRTPKTGGDPHGLSKVSAAGHIVAGTATDIERKQLDPILAALGK